jgi:putative transposase
MCHRECNERTGTRVNRLQYPTDIVCLVVLWRVRYKLSLRDLPEMFLERGLVFTHEIVREWEAQLAPVLRRCCGNTGAAAADRVGIRTRQTLKSKDAGPISTAPSIARGTSWTSF